MVNKKYSETIKKWDDIFANEALSFPKTKNLSNKTFNEGLEWLCSESKRVLDFGCGNGTVLFYCGLKGTQNHIGIDLSLGAITLANKGKGLAPGGEYQFIHGGIEELKHIPENSLDGVVLSNIVDNLYPQDGIDLLVETKRILKPGGKVLLKTNPYMTLDQQKQWGIKVIRGNLLDDGFILWNQTTLEWKKLFSEYFIIKKVEEVYYEDHNTTNRLFYLVNSKNK